MVLSVLEQPAQVFSESKPTLVASGTPEFVSAKAYYIFDGEAGNGEVALAAFNEDEPLPIASVTKLAAAAAWNELVPLSGSTSITWSDLNAEGRAGRFSFGETYTYHDLLFPLLLESSNDAAAVMERETEGDILERMNGYASDLALPHTAFADASGLSDRNVSTAKELALLSTFLKQRHTHVFDITGLNQYILEQNGWPNNNPFISDERYVAGKHGFTYEANRTAVAFFRETFATEDRIIGYVVLGSDDLLEDVGTLRDFVQQSVTFE